MLEKAREALHTGILFRDKRNNSFVENFIDDCAVGNLDKVLEAIGKDIDVNVIGADDDPPIVVAARTGQVAVVETLIQAGADVNGRGMGYYSNSTALMACVGALSQGCGTTFAISEDEKTRLYEVIILLLDKDADVNIRGEDSSTALHSAVNVAVAIKSDRVVKILLDAGADVNAKNSRGKSPLDYAKEIKDDELVRLLTNRQTTKS
ncbi:MAG: ankyrin repeat domain-containing protein [Oscillatoria sp. PMC 1051.18]|nr:ankyrin repeat domain-containing protein [Oscillatoria sp. PMC 1050.18]MEC5032985.1 ankyrin repeat domain-containing protein [Oscillatoria sp. PMC 1051.18]